MTVYHLLMQGERANAEPRHHGGPEQACRLIRLEMENLPLTGELTQEGGNDKSRDTPATKASTDKQIADVVVGTGEMSPVIPVSYTHLTLPTNREV